MDCTSSTRIPSAINSCSMAAISEASVSRTISRNFARTSSGEPPRWRCLMISFMVWIRWARLLISSLMAASSVCFGAGCPGEGGSVLPEV